MRKDSKIPTLTDLIETDIQIRLSELGLDDDAQQPELGLNEEQPEMSAVTQETPADLDQPLSLVIDTGEIESEYHPFQSATEPTTSAITNATSNKKVLEQDIRRILDEHMELAWQEIKLVLDQHLYHTKDEAD